MASDDSSELRLSTDDSKANARKIVAVPSAIGAKQLNKYVYLKDPSFMEPSPITLSYLTLPHFTSPYITLAFLSLLL